MTDKAVLIEKRNELRQRLKDIESDYKRGLDADSEERAQQLENAETLDAIARSLAEELEQIEEQLASL